MLLKPILNTEMMSPNGVTAPMPANISKNLIGIGHLTDTVVFLFRLAFLT